MSQRTVMKLLCLSKTQVRESIQKLCHDCSQGSRQSPLPEQAWDYSFLKALLRLMGGLYAAKIIRMELVRRLVLHYPLPAGLIETSYKDGIYAEVTE